MERLQKIIARSGICSRRKAEELITSGRVTVNNEVITTLGYKASYNDIVTVDGKVIDIMEYKYLVMNKPRFVISSSSDQFKRSTVVSILPEQYRKYRLYPVGRLDYDTKGVLLLTNDGKFFNQLVGPESNVEKEYLVRLNGIISQEELRTIEAGVVIDGYSTKKCKTYFSSADYKNKSCLVGIIITEGKYHQVKRMFGAIGYEVKRLTRIRFGNITADGLKEGEFRDLTPHEIKILLKKQ
ncbi:MAG: rRNA pseudouridine synthase [Bacilli bacterium]|nr:rRNA pseudouridine synthase [Bacilli bacterium]MDD4166591.1 pseudouridine synthase [Endomicrobiaceae bacterium]MDD4388197.1 pseudouridine synthase [Bacilli bacterium]